MEEQDHKQLLKETFNTVSEGYDNPALRFFNESAKHLAGYLELKGNEHVLDAASGTGIASIALAGALPNGHVTGIDFSEGMLKRAKQKVNDMGINNIQFSQMDMQELKFPNGHFDAAASAFGIFFVQDMTEQVRHISNKLKLGGRLVITTFEDISFSPLTDLFFKRLESYGIMAPPETRKRLYTAQQCEELFNGAGLNNVRVEQISMGYHLADAEQWWDIVWNAGFRRYVAQLKGDNSKKFRAEHLQEVNALSTDKGIWLEMEILYTIGVRA